MPCGAGDASRFADQWGLAIADHDETGDAVAMLQPDSRLVAALRPSPNHGVRIGREEPDSLILHYTGMADAESALRWLCDPASSVSCHYVVEEEGRILQLVPEARRAWHAGRGVWDGDTDMNSASIGIEIVNPGHSGGLPPFPEPQIAAVVELSRDIVERYSIAPWRVLAHSDMAPGRKEDPGERFPWDRLFRAGIGLWVEEQGCDETTVFAVGEAGPGVRRFQADLAAFGYGLVPTGTFDAGTATVTRAFQRHYCPARIDGRADGATRRTLAALLTAREAPAPVL